MAEWTISLREMDYLIFVLAPFMGMASVVAAMRLSAKINDPQAANQFTVLVIVPVFMITIGVFGKLLTLNIVAGVRRLPDRLAPGSPDTRNNEQDLQRCNDHAPVARL